MDALGYLHSIIIGHLHIQKHDVIIRIASSCNFLTVQEDGLEFCLLLFLILAYIGSEHLSNRWVIFYHCNLCHDLSLQGLL